MSTRISLTAMALLVALLALPPAAEIPGTPESAQAGAAVYNFCPTRYAASDPNPPYHYATNANGVDSYEWGDWSPQTDYDYYPNNYRSKGAWFGNYDPNSAIYFYNPRDGDYPGVETIAAAQGSGNGATDISGELWSSGGHDVWDVYQYCAYGAGSFLGQLMYIVAEDGNSSSNMVRFPANPRNGRIRFDAPDGAPQGFGAYSRPGGWPGWVSFDPTVVESGQSQPGQYDSGWVTGRYSAFFQFQCPINNAACSAFNSNPGFSAQLGNAVTFGDDNGLIAKLSVNCNATYGMLNDWRQRYWDFANAEDYDAISGCVSSTMGPNEFGWTYLDSFALKLGCNVFAWGNTSGCPTHANDANNNDAAIFANNFVFHNMDREIPTMLTTTDSVFNLDNDEAWDKGNVRLQSQVADYGNGLDAVHVYLGFTDLSSLITANYSGGWGGGTASTSLGNMPCRFWNANSPQTARAEINTWRVYRTHISWWSGGSAMNFNTGPCEPWMQFDSTFNTSNSSSATPWSEGPNAITLQARDYGISDAEDWMENNHWTGWLASPYNNAVPGHEPDNQVYWQRQIWVDNRNPQPSATTINRPASPSMIAAGPTAAQQAPWARGTIAANGSAQDNTSGASGTDVSGISSVELQRSVNGGGYSAVNASSVSAIAGAAGNDNRPPSSGSASYPISGNVNSASHCDGTTLALRTSASDFAGNSLSGNQTVVTVDNTAPADDSTTPNASQWYQAPYTVTVTGHDNQATGSAGQLGGVTCSSWAGSGVHHVEWEVIDTANGNAVVQTGSGANGGSQQVQLNQDRYAVRTYMVDNAGNRSAAKTINPQIDEYPPTLSVTGTRTTWQAGYDTNQTINFTAQDGQTGVTRIDWDYTGGASGSGQIACPSSPCGLSPANWTPNQTFTGEGIFNVRATSRDLANNASTSRAYEVRIDKTSPVDQITSDADVDYGDALRATADDRNNSISRPNDVSGPTNGWFEYCVGNNTTTCPNPDSSQIDSTSYVQANWNRLDQDSVSTPLDSPCVAPDPSTGAGAALAPSGGKNAFYVCSIDTSAMSSGQYMLRFRSFDAAGNGAWSPPQLINLTQRKICVLP